MTDDTPDDDVDAALFVGPETDMAGSIAIRLNFRFRFVFGRTEETFSLWESDSFPAKTELRVVFLLEKVYNLLCFLPTIIVVFFAE